jgi:hypothetical protein
MEDKLDYLPPATNLTPEEIWQKIKHGHIVETFGQATYDRLHDLIIEYADIFSPGIVTGTKLCPPHEIELKPDARPPSCNPHPEGPGRSTVLREHIAAMLANNVIRPSTSPFSAPVVLAKKPDGTWRFCADFRKLNEITIKDRYPLPRIDEVFDIVTKQVVFSAMDLLSGFWQIPVKDSDRHKTAFISSQGL